jgi:hypothetical protein
MLTGSYSDYLKKASVNIRNTLEKALNAHNIECSSIGTITNDIYAVLFEKKEKINKKDFSDDELLLNALAEIITIALIKKEKPETLSDARYIADKGANIAKLLYGNRNK